MNQPVQCSLGTFSAAGSAPFAGLVIEQRVLALHAFESLAEQLGVPLRGATLLALLQHWEYNRHALTQLAAALFYLLEPIRLRFRRQAAGLE